MTSESQKPCVFLLSLDSQPWFDEMYEPLITSLSERARLKRATTARGALNYLGNRPEVVLVTDPGITNPANLTVLEKLKDYVYGGGTAILGCTFSSFIGPSDMDAFFQTHFRLPWKFGDYHRTTVHLNQQAASNLRNTVHLKPAYSQKAVFLKNVEPLAALYTPSTDSQTESFVFPTEPVQDRQQTPVAWVEIGDGRLGYIRDVNTEEGSDKVVLAMCGF